MKKYNYRSIFKLLLVSALLLLCSACEKPAPEPDWPDISGNLTFKDNYKFPPDQLVLDWGMYDVGLNWNIEPRRESQEDIQPEDTFVFHTITNATGDIAAMLAMNYFFSPDDKNSSLFFDYLEQTKEDYKRFEEKDWPLLWQLLGLLFDRQETIETLGKQCLSYTNNYKENRNNTQTGGLLEWRGRHDDTHCI
ncbi:MAG: hypothetical protein LBB91_01735, partial [Clostridiales bacterium]|nr:hypothetical protein [Clostridiales bacterium]